MWLGPSRWHHGEKAIGWPAAKSRGPRPAKASLVEARGESKLVASPSQLQQTLQQQPQLAHFGGVVDLGHFPDQNRQGAVVMYLGKLGNQPAVFDEPLPDADLQLVLGRVAQLHVDDVLEH